jgi:hypothetical protein
MNNIMIQTIKIKAVHGWYGDVEGYAPVDKYSFQVLNMFGSTRVKFSKDEVFNNKRTDTSCRLCL